MPATDQALKTHAHRHGPLYRATLKHARSLHTYFSVLATLTLIFFAATGFMLNHPTWFALDSTRTTESALTVPAGILQSKDKLALVEFLRAHGATGAVDLFDWPGDGEPFHVGFKSPKAQCDADITVATGETKLTVETRGLAGLLTRLHTSREAGPVWRLMVDATTVLLLFACISGLVLWQSLPKRRTKGVIALIASAAAVALAYGLCVP